VRDIENEVKAKLTEARQASRAKEVWKEEVREILRDCHQGGKTTSRKGARNAKSLNTFREFGLKEGEEIREFHDLHIETSEIRRNDHPRPPMCSLRADARATGTEQ